MHEAIGCLSSIIQTVSRNVNLALKDRQVENGCKSMRNIFSHEDERFVCFHSVFSLCTGLQSAYKSLEYRTIKSQTQCKKSRLRRNSLVFAQDSGVGQS